jgi:hypothetical protein
MPTGSLLGSSVPQCRRAGWDFMLLYAIPVGALKFSPSMRRMEMAF